MNRTTAIWFGAAGVSILGFGLLYQVVDPAYYDATSFVDFALVFLQAAVAVVVGVALILLWRDPPVSRGSLFLLFAGVGAVALGIGGFLEDGFGIEDAVWVWFGGGITMFVSLPIAGVAALSVPSPLRWSGLFLIVAAPGYYGFFAVTMGLSWILFAFWIVKQRRVFVYALAALMIPALAMVVYLYAGDVV